MLDIIMVVDGYTICKSLAKWDLKSKLGTTDSLCEKDAEI